MSDFESLVRAMMKNGASAEDITKKTNDILNSINQEKEQTSKAKTAEDFRNETLAHFRYQFNRSYKESNLTIEDAAALCVLVCANSFPKWGKKELEEFYRSMEMNIRTVASTVGKNPGQALVELLDELSDAISTGVNETKSTYSNKREKESECSCKKAGPTGNSKTCTCKSSYKTPEEILIEFINSL